MSIFDYQRLDNILNLLVQREEAIHIEEISSYCNVSDRTIRSDINTINDYIVKHGAHIVLIRKQGYIIEYSDKNEFDTFWNNQDTGTFLFTTSTSRLTYLIRLFLTNNSYITQEYLQSILFVSQNTLYSDFRILKQYLSPYSLKIANKSNLGYRLEGEEQNIRSAIINLIFKENLTDYLTGSITVDRNICNNISYRQFNDIFLNYFSNMIHLDSDYFYRNIFSSLLLAASRVKSGHTLKNFNQSIKLDRHSAKIVENFIQEVESEFNLIFSDMEKDYLQFCIAENYPNFIDDSLTKSNQQLAEEIVKTIQNFLKSLSSSAWVLDSSLEKNLLEHIKLFLKVQVIKGNRNNPLLETIKNSFPYAFDLAINCSQEIVRNYNIHFSEDEISYIALHFANAIERDSTSTLKQLSLAIICGNGRTFSSIIEAKIKRHFPNRFAKIVKFSYSTFQNTEDLEKFDIIISTVPIKTSDFPVIQINIDDLDTSMNQIENKLSELNFLESNDDLFSINRFLVLEERTKKEDVLHLLNNKLLEQGLVNSNFLKDIQKREEISSTTISDSIAVPHPLGDSVIKSSIFPVIAPKGIIWDDKIVKFVFLFAINSENSNQMQQFYDQLLDFISSDKLQTKLLKEANYQTFMDIFSLN
ncbi:BglG family transcription antiterminator [Streptococcus merionis]|uniref:Transcriptional regulator-antiterminator n=1 Tax=Streptococcus merionis TaxID=400065 RepID=A0A239SLL4_9STRE|nr:BglG family transcription antiterminator [Streptococcus merionis]SNU86122.1 transcriptional regulator-antiterminator [Streptococcus merionis]